MRERLIVPVVGVLAFALNAAGCGSSGESEPLSKAAFIKEGNAICASAAEERGSALKEAGEEGAQDFSSSKAELEWAITEVALPPLQVMAEELGDLDAPRGDQKRVDAIVAGFEEGVEKSEADPSGSVTGLPFTEANRRAQAYGLAECTT
jgi:hypothetical protein